ncbi:hypothetical protein [Pseudomonas syringae]|uniref:hypothetical protein n=1 Tax=Pseudomonas syringae TaxID=317 RepID=UPI000467A0D3|nr:hypothetical protein [Pseudomonas syringae]
MSLQFRLLFALLSVPEALAAPPPNVFFDWPVVGSIIENEAVCFESSVELRKRLNAGGLISVEWVKDLLL